LYPAIIAMLLALVFRGVAFEFRFRAQSIRGRSLWDLAFCGGSVIAAFCQGLVLGGVMQGIKVTNRAYAGGWWDWLSPFTLLCGIAVVIGYALLGATWLVWRTEADLQARCRRHAGRLAIATFGLIVAVSITTPLLYPQFTARWFAWPGIVLTSPVPILVAAAGYGLWHGLKQDHQLTPFLCALAWFVLCYAGLGISLYPTIIPPSITFRAAAAPPSSLAFLLVGAAILIPIILIYTGYAYYLFRGKVKAGTHYH
jgi:cytochrome d ubiquinol oxidase subunit II